MTRIGLVQPLRHADFRRMWLGNVVSMIGDGIFLVALAWQVYTIEARPSAYAIVGIAWAAPQLLLFAPAGVLADRVDRRLVMIAGDLLRCVAVGVLGTLALRGAATIPAMVGLAAAFGIGDALFIPSFTSIVPAIIPDDGSQDEQLQANALLEFSNPVTQTLIGPFLGGIVIGAYGTGWAFAADAVTFAFSAAMISRMRYRRDAPESTTSPLEDVREGLAFVRRTRWFWINLVATAISILCTVGTWETLIPYLVKVDLHGSAFALGIVYAAGGVSAMIAAYVMAHRGRLPKRPLTVYYVAWMVGSLPVAGLALAYHLWLVIVLVAIAQSATPVFNVLWFTLEYRLVPADLLGRVSSLDWMIALAGLPISFAIVGPLAGWIGVRDTLFVAGVAGTITMIVPLFIPAALAPERDGSLIPDAISGDGAVSGESPEAVAHITSG